jgi:hypothetical protein
MLRPPWRAAVVSWQLNANQFSSGNDAKSLDSGRGSTRLAAKALTAAVKKCDKNGVSPEVTVQTLISVAVTLLLSCTEAEDAASLLERMAASIRSGEITRDYDA